MHGEEDRSGVGLWLWLHELLHRPITHASSPTHCLHTPAPAGSAAGPPPATGEWEASLRAASNALPATLLGSHGGQRRPRGTRRREGQGCAAGVGCVPLRRAHQHPQLFAAATGVGSHPGHSCFRVRATIHGCHYQLAHVFGEGWGGGRNVPEKLQRTPTPNDGNPRFAPTACLAPLFTVLKSHGWLK